MATRLPIMSNSVREFWGQVTVTFELLLLKLLGAINKESWPWGITGAGGMSPNFGWVARSAFPSKTVPCISMTVTVKLKN